MADEDVTTEKRQEGKTINERDTYFDGVETALGKVLWPIENFWKILDANLWEDEAMQPIISTLEVLIRDAKANLDKMADDLEKFFGGRILLDYAREPMRIEGHLYFKGDMVGARVLKQEAKPAPAAQEGQGGAG
jgi:hypothetical protein